MAKKHIISIGYRHYAADSISAATQAIALLSKLKRVKREAPGKHSDRWIWIPDDDNEEISVELNQEFLDPDATPKAPKKALALPAPKRGTIMCICERSYVAPKQSCPHCGRSFSESHNRTHGSDTAVPPTHRLL
jgi:hypothetical protein